MVAVDWVNVVTGWDLMIRRDTGERFKLVDYDPEHEVMNRWGLAKEDFEIFPAVTPPGAVSLAEYGPVAGRFRPRKRVDHDGNTFWELDDDVLRGLDPAARTITCNPDAGADEQQLLDACLNAWNVLPAEVRVD